MADANNYHCPDGTTVQELKDIANKLRIHSINATNASNSGHPTSCCSAAEIMSVLFFQAMHYDPKNPRDANSDRFVLSKGHAAPVLYAAWAEAGFVAKDSLTKLRKLNCTLEGHPTPRLDFVDVATGSLGQGLSCACGMAYTGKYFDHASYRVYCLIGDGEAAEGSVWEALHFGSHYKLDNLVAIFDINRLGQSEPTSLQHHVEIYQNRLLAFGWNALVIDGHDVLAIAKALDAAKNTKGKPTAIIAKTYKGRGIPGVEDQENWHGKPLGDKAAAAIAEINGHIVNHGAHKLSPPSPVKDAPVLKVNVGSIHLSEPPQYKKEEKVATRMAYGTALAKLGKACDRIIAVDCDVKNSTFSDKFKKAFPDRFIECYIAEQNMVGVAIGCGTRGRTIPFASTFGCFFSRAYDQIRMGAISQANVKFAGSHVGVSIGEDGPSQMALEDLAMFRAIPGCTVFYPSDAVSCERAVELAARTPGMCYIRTSRPATSIVYGNEEKFEVGHAKVVRSSDSDKAVLIGAGVTLFEALKAADTLKAANVNVCVIDVFSVKPLDADTIVNAAKKHGGVVVVVEDHYPEGGIGEAVAAVLAERTTGVLFKHLAVHGLPMSGSPEELVDLFKIGASAIVETTKAAIAAHKK